MTRRESSRIAAAAGALLACAVVSVAFAAGNGVWPHPTYYTVVARPSDTLASLAARYGVSPAAVAKLNRLDVHRSVATGEVLRIPAGSIETREAVLDEALDRSAPNYAPPPKTFGAADDVRPTQVPAVREASAHNVATDAGDAAANPVRRFVWPVRGPVISAFGPASDGQRNDGVNIAAMLGAPIHAAASGTVTYAGDELKGYGNLILIAHPGGYTTAYAHAQSIEVTRGDHVEKGQIIGTAGETGSVDRPQLHFEIREGLKPVNPVRLLASLP